MIKDNLNDYDMVFRPNYELFALIVWIVGAIAALLVSFWSNSTLPLLVVGYCLILGVYRALPAYKTYRKHSSLSESKVELIMFKELEAITKENPDSWWLGNGFDWEQKHRQAIEEISKRNFSDIVPTDDKTLGVPWIDGIEPNKRKLWQSVEHSGLHNLFVGSTGSGKTRLFDIFIAQSVIRRNEPIIILDPKGDTEMLENVRQACIETGQEDRFLYFHPAFPENSVRLDPMKNFGRVTELASRIAALIISEGQNDPFSSFGWQAMNNIAQGLMLINERPQLKTLKKYMEGGAGRLVSRAVVAYAQKVMVDDTSALNEAIIKIEGQTPDNASKTMSKFYYAEIRPEYPNPDLESLLMMFEHDATHFSKMVASLIPIMNMLTSGSLGELLSPDVTDINDHRPITDLKSVIDNNKVIYIGLDSLSDAVVGSAIGSMLLSDLASVAGDRYNYATEMSFVNIYIDEASEVVNGPYLTLLNKSRGSNFRIYSGFQSLSDLAVRLGSTEKATQVLANINNIYSLRTIDNDTQDYITSNLPEVSIKTIELKQGQNAVGGTPMMHNVTQGEAITMERVPLFPPQMLGLLPNIEFIAKLAGGRVVKGRLPILVRENEGES